MDVRHLGDVATGGSECSVDLQSPRTPVDVLRVQGRPHWNDLERILGPRSGSRRRRQRGHLRRSARRERQNLDAARFSEGDYIPDKNLGEKNTTRFAAREDNPSMGRPQKRRRRRLMNFILRR